MSRHHQGAVDHPVAGPRGQLLGQRTGRRPVLQVGGGPVEEPGLRAPRWRPARVGLIGDHEPAAPAPGPRPVMPRRGPRAGRATGPRSTSAGRSELVALAMSQRTPPGRERSTVTKLNRACHRPSTHVIAWSFTPPDRSERIGFSSPDQSTVGGPPTMQACAAPDSSCWVLSGPGGEALARTGRPATPSSRAQPDQCRQPEPRGRTDPPVRTGPPGPAGPCRERAGPPSTWGR